MVSLGPPTATDFICRNPEAQLTQRWRLNAEERGRRTGWYREIWKNTN